MILLINKIYLKIMDLTKLALEDVLMQMGYEKKS